MASIGYSNRLTVVKITKVLVPAKPQSCALRQPAVAEQFLSCPDPRLAAIVASIGYSYRLTVVKITKVPVPDKNAELRFAPAGVP